MKPNFEVYFFETSRGTCPVREFILSQEESTVLKLQRQLSIWKRAVHF